MAGVRLALGSVFTVVALCAVECGVVGAGEELEPVSIRLLFTSAASVAAAFKASSLLSKSCLYS